MATTLSSGLQVVLAGVQAQSVIAIPGNLKQAGVAQAIRVTANAAAFPAGTTTLSIGLSTDGGLTFHTAQMACPGGVAPNGDNTYIMSYALGVDDAPTHTRISFDALVGFSSNVTVEAL